MIGVRPPEYDPAAPQQSATLPVGSPATVRAYVRELAGRHRRAFTLLIGVNTVAVLASMVGPYLLGGLVQDLSTGNRDVHLGRAVGVFLAALVVQAYFVRMVRLRGAILGERILADLREDFLVRLGGAAAGSAGAGRYRRSAVADHHRTSTGCPTPCARPCPNWRSPWCGRRCCSARWPSRPRRLRCRVLVAMPLLLAGCRWYFRRAPRAYRAEAAGYAAVAAVLAESVDAGRTIEAHGLGDRREELSRRRITQWVAWERYTMWLRTVLFPVLNLTHALILTSVLMIGGVFALHGWVTAGELTTGALFAQMLADPVNLILRWYDELQVAQVSLARLVGVREVAAPDGDERISPKGREMAADQVRFGYHAAPTSCTT